MVLTLVPSFDLAGSVLSELDSLKFFTEDVTPAMFFPTVHDAVLSCQHSHPVAQTSTSTWAERVSPFQSCYVVSLGALNVVGLDLRFTFIRLMFALCKTLNLCAEEVEKRVWSFSSTQELRCLRRHSEIIHFFSSPGVPLHVGRAALFRPFIVLEWLYRSARLTWYPTLIMLYETLCYWQDCPSWVTVFLSLCVFEWTLEPQRRVSAGWATDCRRLLRFKMKPARPLTRFDIYECPMSD